MRAPSGPAVGAYVYAKDKKGYWYRAKVLAERGGNPRSYFVHFQGFRSNHDEWVPKARIRLTATKAQIVQLNARVAWMGNTTGLNADENSWEIDEIVGKKHCGGSIKYLVKWELFVFTKPFGQNASLTLKFLARYQITRSGCFGSGCVMGAT